MQINGPDVSSGKSRTPASADVETASGAIDRALASNADVDLSWIPTSKVNKSWAMSFDALTFLARLVRELKPLHVMEFGCGISTGALARESHDRGIGFHLSTVEHDPRFARESLEFVGHRVLHSWFSLSVAPLVGREIGGRYAPVYFPHNINPASIEPADLVIVDGPPGPLGGRFGAIIQGMACCRRNAVVIVDDSTRGGERGALEALERDHPNCIQLRQLPGFERGVAALIVTNPVPFQEMTARLEPVARLPEAVVSDTPWFPQHFRPIHLAAPSTAPASELQATHPPASPFASQSGAEIENLAPYPQSIAVGGPNKATMDFVRTIDARSIAEIGVYRGHTSLEFAKYLDGRGQLHLFDFEDRVEHVLELLSKEGHSNAFGHGNTYKLLDSYNWSLKKVLEKHKSPIFDYVFVDGAHTWAIDALAFLLIDRLLLPGGYVDFDDANWRLSTSPSLRPEVFPTTAALYTREQISTPQVSEILDLLVRRDPRYEEVVQGKIFRKRAVS